MKREKNDDIPWLVDLVAILGHKHGGRKLLLSLIYVSARKHFDAMGRTWTENELEANIRNKLQRGCPQCPAVYVGIPLFKRYERGVWQLHPKVMALIELNPNATAAEIVEMVPRH